HFRRRPEKTRDFFGLFSEQQGSHLQQAARVAVLGALVLAGWVSYLAGVWVGLRQLSALGVGLAAISGGPGSGIESGAAIS
ncbi:unnamed protein product, partial [Amoebophrya sp. A25]